MSEEERDICKYGTPLEQLDEDELPRKRPPTIEDQFALDESGRRRFHGAFTGGFSAGFCNTVGSLEGWTPSTFKSSRSSKAESKFQKPEDFMDTEDREEWGIAPKRLQATKDYSETAAPKRKRLIGPASAIPGEPILQGLLVPPSNNVGVRLLKTMGWREGQGTGPRRAAIDKHKNTTENEADNFTMLSGITFGPNDCEGFEYIPKLDSFGMGYTGLDRSTFTKPFSLFEPATLNIIDKNKKLSISGQAFGVGTFEDEDEDIYHREDMTQYDFTLEDAKKAQAKAKPTSSISSKFKCIEGFISASAPQKKLKNYVLPDVPRNYIPTCGRKTRFGPATRNIDTSEPKVNKQENHLKKGLGRHDLDPTRRRQILEADSNASEAARKKDEEKQRILAQANNITSKLGSVSTFRPFAADPEKERRYNCFVSFDKGARMEKLRFLQPLNMTEWERDRECREFEQAFRLYKPLEGVMSDRFVSGGSKNSKEIRHNSLQTEEEAARNKMFGKLTRKVEPWQPISLLCKRFNVPEPLGGCAPMEELDKKSTNYSIFDYVENPLHNKKDFKNIESAENAPTAQEDILSDNTQTSSSNKTDITSHANKLDLPEPKNNLQEDRSTKKATEFEKKIEENLSAKLPENKNLFKLIFADSSDSEEESNGQDKIKKAMKEMKSYLLSNENLNSKISNHCIKDKLEGSVATDQQPIPNQTIQASGIFKNVDLDSLKTGERKFVFQAPSKTKQSELNVFSTVNLSNSKSTLNSQNPDTKLDLKISEKNMVIDKICVDKSPKSSPKHKKSKKKHKSKDKRKKKKEKKSKKVKDKKEKKKC